MTDTAPPPPRRATATSQIPPSSSRTHAPPPPPPPLSSLGTREQAVGDLIDVLTMPIATVAAIQQMREPDVISPYAMDIYTIQEAKEPIAKAIVKFAEKNPVIAALLDKVGVVSPAAEMIMLGTSLFMQFAENHGRLPSGIAERFPGVTPREDLETRIMEDAEELRVSVNGH